MAKILSRLVAILTLTTRIAWHQPFYWRLLLYPRLPHGFLELKKASNGGWLILLCWIHRSPRRLPQGCLLAAVTWQTSFPPFRFHSVTLWQQCCFPPIWGPHMAFPYKAHPCQVPLHSRASPCQQYHRLTCGIERQHCWHFHEASCPCQLPTHPPLPQCASTELVAMCEEEYCSPFRCIPYSSLPFILSSLSSTSNHMQARDSLPIFIYHHYYTCILLFCLRLLCSFLDSWLSQCQGGVSGRYHEELDQVSYGFHVGFIRDSICDSDSMWFVRSCISTHLV